MQLMTWTTNVPSLGGGIGAGVAPASVCMLTGSGSGSSSGSAMASRSVAAAPTCSGSTVSASFATSSSAGCGSKRSSNVAPDFLELRLVQPLSKRILTVPSARVAVSSAMISAPSSSLYGLSFSPFFLAFSPFFLAFSSLITGSESISLPLRTVAAASTLYRTPTDSATSADTSGTVAAAVSLAARGSGGVAALGSWLCFSAWPVAALSGAGAGAGAGAGIGNSSSSTLPDAAKTLVQPRANLTRSVPSSIAFSVISRISPFFSFPASADFLLTSALIFPSPTLRYRAITGWIGCLA